MNEKLNNKQKAIKQLRNEFEVWDDFLAEIDSKQANVFIYDKRRLKDEIAHLWAWQKLSVSRLEAAKNDGFPDFTEIIEHGFVPEDSKEWDQFNEMIYQKYKNKSWENTYSDWRDNFLYFMELAEEIDNKDYLARNKYVWMNGQPLIDVLSGSFWHHHNDHWPNIIDSNLIVV